MLKIAICDDAKDDLDRAAAILRVYFKKQDIEAEICEFAHPDALLRESEKNNFDIYFLDVIMPMLTGIDVGKELRQRNIKAQIVFLTTSDEFAVEAFSVRAVHYLIKPYSESIFIEAVERALANIATDTPKQMSIKSESGRFVLIDINDIQYVESSNHTQKIHMKNIIHSEMRRSLARILEELEKLSKGQFVSPYKGYIINLNNVITIDTKGILMQGGKMLPIRRGSIRELQEKYLNFRFERR